MSPNNAVPIDARREEFRKYLDKEGILESISKGNLFKRVLTTKPLEDRELFEYVLFSVTYSYKEML